MNLFVREETVSCNSVSPVSSILLLFHAYTVQVLHFCFWQTLSVFRRYVSFFSCSFLCFIELNASQHRLHPGCPKKRDVTFKFRSFSNFEKSSKNSTRLLKWKNHQSDASVKGHTIKTLVKAQKEIHFSLFCKLIRGIKSQ